MLEDDFTYVLRKALMGHGLAPAQAATMAGLPENEVLSFLRGAFSADTATHLAKALRLNPDAFAKHDFYQPKPLAISGIDRIDLPFKNEQVNAWMIRSGGAIVLIDTGYDANDLIRAVDALCGRLPDRIFITHAHVDHVGAMDYYLAAGVPIHSNGLPGTILMKPGDEVFCGALPIRACDLSGHANPALGFHIGGLEKPTLVTGDALFAGSMGGCASPEIYQLAVRNLGIVLGPLPDDTVILPGHGPTTTLGEERIANPFL